VGLEWGPLSLKNPTEELHGRKSSGFGLENRENGRMDPLRWPRGTLYPQKLALTSPTSGILSVGVLRSRTQATVLLLFLSLLLKWTANGFLLGGIGTTIRHNTQNYTYHPNSTPRSDKTQHTALHTMKNTLHTMTTIQKKGKLSL
jgi:hypothetical protein